MIGRELAPRYAKVLFSMDCMKGNLVQRLVDFESMIKLLGDNPRLVNFLKTPQISLKDKKEILRNSLKGIFDQTFMDFLFYLIKKGRLMLLGHIADAFKLMVNEHFGIWEADIVTAVPLDAGSEEKLKQKMENDFRKKIRLNKKVDPTIIGGVILIIANEMLDWSVTGRLKKLKESLIATQAGVP